MKRPFFALLCLGLLTLLGTACQQPVEGCTHPRAQNFDPEADVDMDCNYYQLEIQWQHYAASLPSSDTVLQGSWMTDAAGEFFYLDKCHILGSEMRLYAVGDNEATEGAGTVIIPTTEGFQEVVDNFFSIRLNQFSTNAVGWTELGDFDRLELMLGIDPRFQAADPDDLEVSNHPLGQSANPFVYDSTLTQYTTLQLTAIQPNNNNRKVEVALTTPISYSFPYLATVRDGENVPIRLRLDYDLMLQGIRWSTDSDSIIRLRLLTNLPNALTTY